MAALQVLKGGQTPQTVIDRANLSRAALTIGGFVTNLDIHLGAAETAFESLENQIHESAKDSAIIGDREAYAAAQNDIRDGEYLKLLVSLDQLDQAADALEAMAKRIRAMSHRSAFVAEGSAAEYLEREALTQSLAGVR